MLEALRSEAESLRAATGGLENDDLRREFAEFADAVVAETIVIETRLRRRGRVSAILLAGLDYDYARHIYLARRIQRAHEDDPLEADSAPLEGMIEILKFFAIGRDHFTTLYFKREVQNLSRNLLILSLPVIVFTSHVLLAIDAGLFPSSTAFGIQPRLLYISIAYAIALSPYILLSAYMLRILTVSKYSLRAGSLTVPERDALIG